MGHPAPAVVPGHRQAVIISVVDGQIQVDPDTFSISKSKQEEVIWQTTDPNLVFTIDFQESPFGQSQFDNEHPASGPVRRSVPADPKKRYKYSVTASGVTEPLDPTGVITK